MTQPACIIPEAKTRDAARTTGAILRAAQRLFAAQGYTTTGVREVAAEAGVNSALVRRYFGSKEGLLRAAVEDVLQVQPFITGDRATFGTRAVTILLHGEALPNPLAMMLLATADPAARALCRDLMHERIVMPLATWLGGADAAGRAAQINVLWMGFLSARQILPLQPLFDSEPAALQWLAEATQALADGTAA